MHGSHFTLTDLWAEAHFTPNPAQRDAIMHVDGPLYLPAGPGSGKTRVLLWRTLNLIVFSGVPPEEIFLATFTEKAAHQLKEGLRALLGMVSARSGVTYDIGRMYIGTIHGLCQRLLKDRRFYPHRQLGSVPFLLDDLDQYFTLYDKATWQDLTTSGGFSEGANRTINLLFGSESQSRHSAVTNCMQLFNRLSEESVNVTAARTCVSDPTLQGLLTMYEHYKALLQPDEGPRRTDFALLQQAALDMLTAYPGAEHIFKHVIIDEYQDTNTIQERLFFTLAAGQQNLCVVGDDDQALYRFRGATVENFVQFPSRCAAAFGRSPITIPLATNYRSRAQIVRFYADVMTRWNWRHDRRPGEQYRIADKRIQAHSTDAGPAVIASTFTAPDAVCQEIARLTRQLIDTGKVNDPNQIAFLFPSLKGRGGMNVHVRRMQAALEAEGLRVYAPRAGRFLEGEEATALFGVYLHIFGQPDRGTFGGLDYAAFHDWLDTAAARAARLVAADPHLATYVRDRTQELAAVQDDYARLIAVAQQHGWGLKGSYRAEVMRDALAGAQGLSAAARNAILNRGFAQLVLRRADEGRPFSLQYIITRATSLDWTVLDLFYELAGFRHFRQLIDLAERGEDEGPACNLGLLSRYLARFMDQYAPELTASFLSGGAFQRTFFAQYLFALFRRSEGEYEDADDPFPRGRIPFLTIHQAKGLEFPVVVLANPRKDNRGPQTVERLVQPLLDRDGEPLDRMAGFDIMRMFYVALSRAKNLLIIAHPRGQGICVNEPFKTLLDTRFPRIPDFDVSTLPASHQDATATPHTYSYTGDYLLYQKCPRQYMIFRHYGFVPSRSQTMMFGSLVHRTMEDLHHYLIAERMAL